MLSSTCPDGRRLSCAPCCSSCTDGTNGNATHQRRSCSQRACCFGRAAVLQGACRWSIRLLGVPASSRPRAIGWQRDEIGTALVKPCSFLFSSHLRQLQQELFRSSEHVFYYPTVRFCDQCHCKKILQKSIFILIFFFILGDRLFRPPYAISSLSVCLSVLSVTLVYILWPNGWMHEDELAWR